MTTILLLVLCLAVVYPAQAESLKQAVEALYRPVEAETIKLMTLLPPRISQAARNRKDGSPEAGNGSRCPQNINIGSVQGQQNRLPRFDSTVVIDAPIVIKCP
jgi:hypothetical protein